MYGETFVSAFRRNMLNPAAGWVIWIQVAAQETTRGECVDNTRNLQGL